MAQFVTKFIPQQGKRFVTSRRESSSESGAGMFFVFGDLHIILFIAVEIRDLNLGRSIFLGDFEAVLFGYGSACPMLENEQTGSVAMLLIS